MGKKKLPPVTTRHTDKMLEFTFRKSISRASKGEQACTLTVNGRKVSRAVGGKNMIARCIAGWIETCFESRLLELFREDIDILHKKYLQRLNKNADYRQVYAQDFKEVCIHEVHQRKYGRCQESIKLSISLENVHSFQTVSEIAKRIGIELQWLRTYREDATYYQATVKPEYNANTNSKETNRAA